MRFTFVSYCVSGHHPNLSSIPSCRRARTLYARCEDSDRYARYAGVHVDHRNGTEIWVDDRNHVLYCLIPKVACTTFAALIASSASKTRLEKLVNLTNMTDTANVVHGGHFFDDHNVTRLKSYDIGEIAIRLKTYFKFVAVRHPFDRLLSAWRDKKEFTTYHKQVNIGSREQMERFHTFLQEVADGSKDKHWNPMAAAIHVLCSTTVSSG